MSTSNQTSNPKPTKDDRKTGWLYISLGIIWLLFSLVVIEIPKGNGSSIAGSIIGQLLLPLLLINYGYSFLSGRHAKKVADKKAESSSIGHNIEPPQPIKSLPSNQQPRSKAQGNVWKKTLIVTLVFILIVVIAYNGPWAN